MPTPLQQRIIETLNVKPTIDPEEEFRARVEFLKDYTKRSGTKGYVLGISGGQDSAVTGALCAQAVRELREETGDGSYQFLALLLPYGEQRDADEAREVAEEFIHADKVINFNIKPMVDALAAEFNTHADSEEGLLPLKDYHKGNVKARARMTVQYAYAGQYGLLVAGTDNADENTMGFATKGGDLLADVSPITGLNKRQGKQILRFLNAPSFLFSKAPTADLLDENPGQEDETELGVQYTDIDDFLEGREVEPAKVAMIEQWHRISEHKRQLPVTLDDVWYK